MDHIADKIYELPGDIIIKCNKDCKDALWSVLDKYSSNEPEFLKQVVLVLPENVRIIARKYIQLGYLVESFEGRKIVLRIPDDKAVEIESAFNKALQRLENEYAAEGFLPIKFNGGSLRIFNMEEFKESVLNSINKKSNPA